MAEQSEHKTNPSWWTEQHSSAWDRAKGAFARDWEQTKADFTKSGKDLQQNVVDTVKQATGHQSIPPEDVPNTRLNDNKRDDYASAEPALRYGFGASSHFVDHEGWDSSLESKLRLEWDGLYGDSDWSRVRPQVRSGWERGRDRS